VRKKTECFDDYSHEALRDPEAAANYLSAASDDTLEMFLMAIRDVAESHKMSHVALGAELNRESLYKALSANGNPRYQTLKCILDVVGLKFAIVPKQPARCSAPRARKASLRKSHVRVATRARRKQA
jgi:probable addiction module antidote protein